MGLCEKDYELDPNYSERVAKKLEFWENKKRQIKEQQRARELERKQQREQELDQAILDMQDELDDAEPEEELAIYQDENTEQELLYND